MPGRFERVVLYLPAAFFFILTGVSLSLVEAGRISGTTIAIISFWVGAVAAAEYAIHRWAPDTDHFLLPIVTFLMGWGLWLVARLAPNFLLRQSIWAGLGLLVIVIVTCWPTDLRLLRRYPYTLFLIGLSLLAATFLFGVNPAGASARYWLKLPFINAYFQPSELLKLFFILFLASYFDQRESLLRFDRNVGRFGPLPYLLPLLMMWSFCIGLLVWQRDLGAATLFFVLFVVLLYFASGDGLYLMLGGAMAAAAGWIGYSLFDVVRLRVDAWINPWPDASGRAFQIVQSLYAIASGGVMGDGIGQGYPDYIPVVHSDFVFAAIAEEWGLIGSAIVIICFATLMARAFRISVHARWPFSTYVSAGIGILLATQTILIMGGVTRLLPLTGVTLPFVSYGGSSMVVSALMIGLLGQESRHIHTGLDERPLTSSQVEHHAVRLKRILSVFLVVFGALIGFLVTWGVLRAEQFAVREDNPRGVEAELRTVRGRIVDTNGVVLASNDSAVAFGDPQIRLYPLPIAEPVVGYYSLRHGTAGVEQAMDEILRGADRSAVEQVWNDWLNAPAVGRSIRLTLEIDLQANAMQLLDGKKGAVVLMSLPDGAIRAMGSAPTIDPNFLDEKFDQLIEDEDAPLLNRAAQGRYQPGRVLEPFLIASAIENGDITASRLPEVLEFQTSPTSWLVSLERSWGRADLQAAWDRFRFLSLPSVPIPLNDEIQSDIDAFRAALTGEDLMTVVPLQVAIAAATLANGGELIQPQLVAAVEDSETAEWVAYTADQGNAEEFSGRVVSEMTASDVLGRLPESDQGVEWVVTVQAGPDTSNSWYVGIAPQYVVVVVLEHELGQEEGQAAQVGRELLRLARE